MLDATDVVGGRETGTTEEARTPSDEVRACCIEWNISSLRFRSKLSCNDSISRIPRLPADPSSHATPKSPWSDQLGHSQSGR